MPGLRQKAWAAMRLARRFTLADLVLLAADSDTRNTRGRLGRFLRLLRAEGYVAELGGGREKVFRLIKNTGTNAPEWRKGRLIDGNEGDGGKKLGTAGRAGFGSAAPRGGKAGQHHSSCR